MQAHQLLLWEDESTLLDQIHEIRESQGNLRRGLFQRFDLLKREIDLLREEIDLLRMHQK